MKKKETRGEISEADIQLSSIKKEGKEVKVNRRNRILNHQQVKVGKDIKQQRYPWMCPQPHSKVF